LAWWSENASVRLQGYVTFVPRAPYRKPIPQLRLFAPRNPALEAIPKSWFTGDSTFPVFAPDVRPALAAIRCIDRGGRVVARRIYDALGLRCSPAPRRADLPHASPNALVIGYGRALAEILAQLASELGNIENRK
jgi:hypothetical protein